jgi:NIPSNAP
MLYELRTYDFAPGDAVRYIEMFRREGLPLITAHLPLAGYWLTEIGPLNRIHHMWVYRDIADRAARRTGFMADKRWTEGFLPRGMALIRRQESRLLRLVSGSRRLEAVAEVAQRPHAAEMPEAPVFANGWLSLTMTGDELAMAPTEAQLACWVVVAGDNSGAHVTLISTPSAAAIGIAPTGATSHEILRPCRFSPLG